MADETLAPLILRLDSYQIAPDDGGAVVAHRVLGDSHAGHIPHVHAMIEAKGYRVVDFDGMMDLLIDAITRVEDPFARLTIWSAAMQLVVQRGKFAGQTAHSSDEQVLVNHVSFDYDRFDPNMRFVVSVHELGHVLTDRVANDAFSKMREKQHVDHRRVLQHMECLAYGVEFVVCKHFGLDTEEHVLQGMKIYGITSAQVQEHTPEILRAANEVIEWLTTKSAS